MFHLYKFEILQCNSPNRFIL